MLVTLATGRYPQIPKARSIQSQWQRTKVSVAKIQAWNSGPSQSLSRHLASWCKNATCAYQRASRHCWTLPAQPVHVLCRFWGSPWFSGKTQTVKAVRNILSPSIVYLDFHLVPQQAEYNSFLAVESFEATPNHHTHAGTQLHSTASSVCRFVGSVSLEWSETVEAPCALGLGRLHRW